MKTKPTQTLVRSNGEKAILATALGTAENFVSRSVGLLGRDSLPIGEGLWIKRCNSIHTFFMRFPIDAVFVDNKLKVVAVHKGLKPWRVTRLHFKASSVFELPAGTIAGLKGFAVGDQLAIESENKNGGRLS